MLKAPPLIPWTYISQYQKIDPTEGGKICSKNVQKYKCPEIKRYIKKYVLVYLISPCSHRIFVIGWFL